MHMNKAFTHGAVKLFKVKSTYNTYSAVVFDAILSGSTASFICIHKDLFYCSLWILN